jgi:hypothetical protein
LALVEETGHQGIAKNQQGQVGEAQALSAKLAKAVIARDRAVLEALPGAL